MNHRVIQVPISLLHNRTLAPSVKLVWMALQLHRASTPGELQAATGLSRHTLLNALAGARACARMPPGPRVQLPAGLLAERTVGARAKLLYGLLQTVPGFRGRSGQFTYTALCSLTQFDRTTLKRAVAELRDTNWLQTTQSRRLSPLRFWLGSPELRRSQAAAALAKRHLGRAQYGGEAIMQEYLSLLVASDQFTDNARPGFLVNPQTGERLELDRFYQPRLAFEFNGAQHYRATGRFTQAEADAQHFRDLIKAGICLYRGIHLVIIHPEDLSLQGMIRKIGSSAPLRDLAGQEPLIDLLETASISYLAAARSQAALEAT